MCAILRGKKANSFVVLSLRVQVVAIKKMVGQTVRVTTGKRKRNSPLYSVRDEYRIVGTNPDKPAEEFRSPWRRDIARLIHSPAFRRLQGKTQVFPRSESDFVRTRLTHSLEVAQIAKSIAIRLNARDDFFRAKTRQIQPDVVEFAGMAHDLGHPPFGHNGEEALDDLMKGHGGFEGNAQTLRILTKLEKKQLLNGGKSVEQAFDDKGNDLRCGLNLTSRSLASILKYDSMIPERHEDRVEEGVQKGYYFHEEDIVKKIRKDVLKGKISKKFKTIECSIMDVADDIAYATYDIEDVAKLKFFRLVDYLFPGEGTLKEIAETIEKRSRKYYPDMPSEYHAVSSNDIMINIFEIIGEIFEFTPDQSSSLRTLEGDRAKNIVTVFIVNEASNKITNDGYSRTKFTSGLVQEFLDAVEVRYNEEIPALSQVRLQHKTFKKLETLKNLTYCMTINSNALKISEYRSKDILNGIFSAFASEKGHKLLPDDCRLIFGKARSAVLRKRIICDFISGMTDSYAIEVYDKLYSSANASIFKGTS